MPSLSLLSQDLCSSFIMQLVTINSQYTAYQILCFTLLSSCCGDYGLLFGCDV